MFLPLKDINPTSRKPVISISLIVINVMVFLYQLSLGSANSTLIASLGATPAEITQMTDLVGRTGYNFIHAPGPSPIFLTLFTSMFMHGSILHVGSNMLYLWIFGNNVEDILGPGRFLIFYFLCGLTAHALHIASDPSSIIPTIGASGAIAGLMAGYLLVFPAARIVTLVFLFFFIRLTVMPAYVIIAFWFVIQLINGFGSLGALQTGGVAWFAHIGGFLAGIGLTLAMAGEKVTLFDRIRNR
ncbi:MAG: rhomboid family intramembrane serine protease [Candidatus Latescibacteria bacterium]|nr:rhomboid family intramembrane serine protease [bacterium]MBD3424632.1 rhomboid family intramembrane serine protease [Candidatus Latescibacterota bacterium]